MQETQMIWAARLRAAREHRGLTQRDVARRCGVSVSTISRIESGLVSASDELKWCIAAALGERMDLLWAWPAVIPPGERAATRQERPAATLAPHPEEPPAREAPGVVSVRELAAMLGVQPATLYAHLESGKFPLKPLNLPGRTRFSRVQVERFLAGEPPA